MLGAAYVQIMDSIFRMLPQSVPQGSDIKVDLSFIEMFILRPHHL